jgi:aminopeptidase N
MKLLDKHILPTNYTIHFHLEDENFSGKETITLDVRTPCTKLLLHGKNINITRASLESSSIPLKNISYGHDIITIKHKFPQGKIKLDLTFTGKYGHVTGLYKSSYKDGFMFTTQFEAAHAREAFPCVDEPMAKATFDISITCKKNFDAISNMKLLNKISKNGKVTHVFATSPIMSTYLLYLGAGRFDYLEETYQKKHIRIVTVPGKAKKYGTFAMEATKKFLTYFEKYFGIKYPLEKLDMIAVPDFGSGAMENWGAITYREDALLYDPKVSSLTAKQRVAEVISHELVHQWFGNLVTMKWWNDLWLNESFADYMAYKAVAHHYPEMDPWSVFLNRRVSGAYFLDSLTTSHPINVKVESPVQIREVFDAISYSKGGMVLRMLEHYIGENVFKRGLHNYLNEHAYGNAEGNDLWKSLGNVSDKPVEKVMDNWLHQMGFPLVSVEKVGKKVALSQKRFQFIAANDKKKWIIPISTANGYVLMDKKTMHIPLGKSVKINTGEKGFYRVKYSAELVEEMKRSFSTLDSIDAWGVYSDSFALCLATEIRVDEYLSLVALYEKSAYIVVGEVLGCLGKLGLLGDLPGVREATESFCNRLLERYGWKKKPGEKETDGSLRSAVIHKLGRLDNQEVLTQVQKLFSGFLKRPASVDPDMRSTMYNLMAWQGDEKTYEKLLRLYKHSENPQEQLQILASLGCFKQEKLLKRSLKLALTDAVRHQNIVHLVGTMCGNPHGRTLVWPWVKQNYPAIKKIFSHYVWHFNSVLSYLSLLADRKLGQEIKEFLEKDPIPGTQRALEQTLEKMAVYEHFLKNV